MSPRREAVAHVFAARARRRRRQRLSRVAVGVIGLAAAIGATWLVGWSNVLAVNDVGVRGVDAPLADRVRAAAQAPTGVPLVRVDTAAMAQRVAELAEVASVEVHRSWPDALTIEVRPRVPAAAVSDGTTWWQVDESGVMFGESSAPPEGVPVLSAPLGPDDGPVRAAGTAVLTGLPAEVRELVASVEARSEADVRLELSDGSAVRWGTADRIADKAQVLLALIAVQSEPVSVYDVSAPERPAVVP